jgi:hypothetical protein
MSHVRSGAYAACWYEQQTSNLRRAPVPRRCEFASQERREGLKLIVSGPRDFADRDYSSV